MRDEHDTGSLDALIDDTARAMTAGQPSPRLRAAVADRIGSRGGRWRVPVYAMATAAAVLALALLWPRTVERTTPAAPPQPVETVVAATPLAVPAAPPGPSAPPVTPTAAPPSAIAEQLEPLSPPIFVEPLELPELAVSELEIPLVTVDALPVPPALP